MKVKEVADLVGISVRTLHHYDEIGLLTPDGSTDAGYRLYSDNNLETLQQILFFKELGFPLKSIKEMMSSPTFDRLEALQLHHRMLKEKRDRLDQMIETVEKTIQHAKGEIQMTHEEKFAGFDFRDNPYEQEARERWGNKSVDEANATLTKMTQQERKAFAQTFDSIYRQLAAVRHLAADSAEAQREIQQWYDFLTSSFPNQYSLEAFKGLGQMYVDDERFTKNIDQYGPGLAVFMRDAMAVFADQHKQ